MRFHTPLVLPGRTARAIAEFASQDDGRPMLQHVALWFADDSDCWVMQATDQFSMIVASNDRSMTAGDLIDVASERPQHLLAPGVVKVMHATRKTTGELMITSPAVISVDGPGGMWRFRAAWSGANLSQWPANARKLWNGEIDPDVGPHMDLTSTTLSKVAKFTDVTGTPIRLLGRPSGGSAKSSLVWQTMQQTGNPVSAFGLCMCVRV